jgi:hypothetical protein
MGAAIANVILDASRSVDGERSVDSALVRQAMAGVLVAVPEALPFIPTGEQMQDACQLHATKTFIKMMAR